MEYSLFHTDLQLSKKKLVTIKWILHELKLFIEIIHVSVLLSTYQNKLCTLL